MAQRDVEILRALGHLLRGVHRRGALRVDLAPCGRHARRTRLAALAGDIGLRDGIQGGIHVQAAGAGVGLHQVPQIAPVLLPQVAHQVRRQHAAGHFAFLRPVFPIQLAARVAVQLFVQRLDLVPQAVGLGGQFGRGHVVAGAPHFAGIGEAHFLCAFIHQSGEAHVVLAHRLADRVPAIECIQLRVVVAAGRQHFTELADVAAGLGVTFAGAIAAGAVHAFHARRDPGEFGQLGGIFRRGHRRHQLDQLDRARGGGRQLLAVVTPGLFDPGIEPGQPAFVRFGRDQLAVAVDVGARQPLRRIEFRADVAKFVIDPGDELIGGFRCGRRGNAAGRRGCCGRGVAVAGSKAKGADDGECKQGGA